MAPTDIESTDVRLARIEEKVDILVAHRADSETRLRKLEKFEAKVAVIAVIAGLVGSSIAGRLHF
jgi:tetrahydromethanopterin S-methyltransferase subunit G